jgi:hypothetical protein
VVGAIVFTPGIFIDKDTLRQWTARLYDIAMNSVRNMQW